MTVAPYAVVDNHISELEHAFPKVDPQVKPCGSRLLVQIRTPKTKSAGGIILTGETKDTEKWNTQVARVVEIGPLAFKNRETMQPWPEGAWVSEGDFVRVPKYGGDRFEVAIEGRKDEPALFVIVNDLDVVGKITGDPLKVKAFI